MKLSTLLTIGAATAVAARSIPVEEREEKFLVQLSETETKLVTEEEKWAMRRQGIKFFDRTYDESTDKDAATTAAVKYTYPEQAKHVAHVKTLIQKMSKASMRKHLTKFSSFHNRFWKSETGTQSSAWLLKLVKEIIADSGAEGASAKAFPHPRWTQDSIIVTIPGKSKKTVVLGSHQDSINLNSNTPKTARAPGADDNGSGSMTIVEAMIAYLSDPKVKAGKAANTVEFHWYAAEEEGLLGSQAIFKQYKREGRKVAAMLAQDMTGYTKGTVEAGDPIEVGIITDHVNKDLTEFLKTMVDAYCTIPYIETKCGYACSDHASADDAGFPSSFVFESDFGNDSPYIHSAKDTIDTVNFNHMLQHARLSLGYAYELAFADLEEQ